MARDYFHVVYAEGVWNITADRRHSGLYLTWGEALTAGIERGCRSVRRRVLIARTQAIEEIGSVPICVGQDNRRRS
jgi:hypothetical protein